MNGSVSLPAWKRAVVKVGSSLVAPKGRAGSVRHALHIAQFIGEQRRQGREIVLVSSGAVAVGLSEQPAMRAGQLSIPEKQALAAIGQASLVQSWARFFDGPVAQILLTYDDLYNRRRYVNAKNTFAELLKLGALPIVNENDTVAVDELRVGDNDNLAAYVAAVVEADLLILCSDVDGLFDADPRVNPDAKLIRHVDTINETLMASAAGPSASFATGGMRTKLEAARKATDRGINVALVNGWKPLSLQTLGEGAVTGTLFTGNAAPIGARKHWVRHVPREMGRIVVDAGAAEALQQRGASLLPSGILEVIGGFMPGETVGVVTQQGDKFVPVAKGISQYGSRDLRKIVGKQSSEIEAILGFAGSPTIIQRDDLVIV